MNRFEFYSNVADYESKRSLSHYGTKGQRWGIRHWQNYDGTFNEAGKERYFGSKGNKEGSDENKEGVPVPVAAGLGVWLGLVALEVGAPPAAMAIHDARVSKKIKKYEQNLATEETDEKTGYKLKNEKMLNNTTKEDMQYVNMEHSYRGMTQKARDAQEGRSMNCSLCTSAMVLRQKGYDVRAGVTMDGTTYQEQEKRYKGGKFTLGKFNDIIGKLEKEPEGSYGHFSVEWREAFGGAHSMFYKIENGKPVIYDCQTNKIYKTKDIYKIASPLDDKTKFMRCDNLEVNFDYMKKNKIVY